MMPFAKNKIKIRLRRRAWRPYKLGLYNYNFINDKALKKKMSKNV